MSFSTLPPDSRTLVSKLNTKLALIWKEDFVPLGNSSVLLHLSPGKTPLMTTVAKFLDTSVCGGSWCLDLSISPFLMKFTQILESILLDNPHKAAVLSVGCASFSSTLFHHGPIMCIWANRRPHGNVDWVVLTKFDTLFCFVFVYFLVAYLICINISGIDMHDDCPTIVYILRTLLFYFFTLKTEFGFFFLCACTGAFSHIHSLCFQLYC